ncbi:MAG: type II toxin-antitoxin system prevent-host-death family antitoxin [Candidatus Aegiribacteria sp.]|nr:type II toxin-antitoxin system prevent-host-death family antitoxin [Candidatus Aegiribacteria sp.]
MKSVWQLQEAKNKFSKVVEKARHDGPQIVTKNGKESVVILSIEEYQKIVKPKINLLEFMHNSPLAEESLDFERDKSFSREIEL